MEAAYNQVAGAVPVTETERGAGLISGETFTPGIYKWSSTVSFAGTITFDGGPNDEFIMQIAQTFTVGSSARMELLNGAQAKNVYWAIAGVVDFGTASHGEGIFLAKTNISFKNGSSLNGAAYAQTAVTMIGTTIGPP